MISARTAQALQTDFAPRVAEVSSEQNLFLQVIAVAVQDYRGGCVAGMSKYRAMHTRHAAAWLFSPIHEKDFFEVCRLADVDPDFVRRIAQRKEALAWSRS